MKLADRLSRIEQVHRARRARMHTQGPSLIRICSPCGTVSTLFRLVPGTGLVTVPEADDLAELVDLADAQRNLTDRATFERARGRPV